MKFVTMALCAASSAAMAGSAACADMAAEGAAPQPAAAALVADADTVSDIVVTARRKEESLQNVPVSVTVASQDTLERLAITSPETLTKLDPALVLANRQGSRDVFTPFIRGQGAASSSGATQSVITYFAEIPFFRPSFVDLQNIQVLKGPQGTLFGETATGGVVLFSPRKPGNAFEGYVTAEAGNYSYRMVEGALTVPIIDEVWSVRAAGQIRKRRGYTKLFFSQPGTPPTDADNIDTSDLRLSSVFRPLPDLEIYTVLARNTSDNNGSGYVLSGIYDRVPTMRLTPANIPAMAAAYQYFSGLPAPAGLTFLQIEQNSYARQLAAGPRTSFASHALNTTSSFTGLANSITLDVGDFRIRNMTGLFRSRVGPNNGLNPDASDAPVADNIGAICIQGVSPRSCRVNGPKTFTNELQVQGDLLDGRLSVQAGGYYRKVSGAPWSAAAQFVVYATSTGNNTSLTRSGSESYAAYGQATLEVLDGVHITGGVRNTWDQTKTESTRGAPISTVFNGTTINLSAFAPSPVPGAPVTTFKPPRSSATSYTISGDWQVTENVLAWLTHRRGYKPGGVNRLIATTDPRYIYGPETLTDFEAGIRGSFKLGSVPIRTTLVGYRGKYSDIQRSSFGVDSATGNYVQLTQNVAGATIKGLEFSVDVSPTPWFDIGGYVAYNDAQFDDWVETQTCARQPFRAGCAGLASAVAAVTPVVIDHVAGTVTARNITETFKPDRFAQAPKVRWSLRPAINFGALSETLQGARLSANISYTSSHATPDSNYTVGLAKKDTIVPGYTLVDLRLDWTDLPLAQGTDLFIGVTNLFDRTLPVEITEVTSTCDCVFSIYNEPRMIYAGFKYSF